MISSMRTTRAMVSVEVKLMSRRAKVKWQIRMLGITAEALGLFRADTHIMLKSVSVETTATARYMLTRLCRLGNATEKSRCY